MRIYTEEQIRSMLNSMGRFIDEQVDDYIDSLTPIELPSDEEIEKFAFEKYHDIEDSRWFEPLQVGAKWVINEIQGGNK